MATEKLTAPKQSAVRIALGEAGYVAPPAPPAPPPAAAAATVPAMLRDPYSFRGQSPRMAFHDEVSYHVADFIGGESRTFVRQERMKVISMREALELADYVAQFVANNGLHRMRAEVQCLTHGSHHIRDIPEDAVAYFVKRVQHY